jgi:hypothetical protein
MLRTGEQLLRDGICSSTLVRHGDVAAGPELSAATAFPFIAAGILDVGARGGFGAVVAGSILRLRGQAPEDPRCSVEQPCRGRRQDSASFCMHTAQNAESTSVSEETRTKWAVVVVDFFCTAYLDCSNELGLLQ